MGRPKGSKTVKGIRSAQSFVVAASPVTADELVWPEMLLAAFCESGNFADACKLAGVSRMTVWRRRQADPEFDSAFIEAKELAVQTLEEIAYDRARAKSDLLMMFLLKAARPEMYREKYRYEHTGSDGKGIEICVSYEQLVGTTAALPAEGVLDAEFSSVGDAEGDAEGIVSFADSSFGSDAGISESE